MPKKPPTPTSTPTTPPRPRKQLPACLAPAMLEWAMEQSPEECHRLLTPPEIPGVVCKAMVPIKNSD